MSTESFRCTGRGGNRREVVDSAIRQAASWFEVDVSRIGYDLSTEDIESIETAVHGGEVIRRTYRASVRTWVKEGKA